MTYAQLKTKVADWINRTDLTPQIADCVNMALHRVEREHNFNYMVSRATGTLSADTITAPTRYKETKTLMVNSGGVNYYLTKDSYESMMAAFPRGSNETGIPSFFAYLPSDGNLYLRTYPASAYTYEMLTYVFSADMSADGDTNWLSLNAWEVLLYGALMEVSTLTGDTASIGLWQSMYQKKLDEIKKADMSEQFSGYQQIKSSYVT